MPKLFQFLVIVFALFWCSTMLAQDKGIVNTNAEVSPTQTQQLSDPPIDAMWDVLLDFDIVALSGAPGNAGCEWDGTSFYSTRWASNLLHEYSADGTTLIREFSVAGVTGLRDLAYDGTYFYGGAAANTIYQMDFSTSTLVGTIPSPVAVRFIAYDEANDAFWVGNWSDPPTLVDRSGNALATITTGFAGQYGAAYDNVSPGGPFLWVFDQGGGEGTPQLIHQFDIATGTATGVTHDVMSDVGSTQSGIAGGLFSMTDFASGLFTIGGLLQGGSLVPGPDLIFVYEVATAGPPCPVDPPTDPTPANGATGIPVTGNTAMWTNGNGTTGVEVYFGTPGNLTQVYDGTPITSLSLAALEPLTYDTDYAWRVVNKNDTCGVSGPTWTFTTEIDPNLNCVFFDDFESGTGNWTITNDGGTCVWEIFFPTYPNAYNLPPGAGGGLLCADSDECGSGTTLLTSAVAGPFDATDYQSGAIDFDSDFNAIDGDDACYVEISLDGGSTWTEVWSQIGVDLSGHETVDISALIDQQPAFWIKFRSVQPGWDWWWVVDNVEICLWDIIPVELVSFTASTIDNQVTLNWATASELNNHGFEVQRSSNGDFVTVGFVQGFGTTSETQNYTYTDREIPAGFYSYRLKQIDLDGSFSYSDVVEVDVTGVREYALHQNYPNPFNPSTKIEFSLAIDSKVNLKVFDVLGQEVVTLINTDLVAGAHNINFDASNLNSGVYFYRLEAQGVNGATFTLTRKMILTK